MATQGFIVSTATVATIGTTMAVDKVITLTGDTARDGRAEDIPSGAIASHILVRLDVLSGASDPPLVDAAIWRDAICDDLYAGPTQTAIKTQASLTDTSVYSCVIPLDDIRPARTSDNLNLTSLYLTLALDAGTASCVWAEIHWFLPSQRG